VRDERPVGPADRLVDGQEHAVIREQVRTRFPADRHADVLPDLHADRAVVE
jgi:hypothetical protein